MSSGSFIFCELAAVTTLSPLLLFIDRLLTLVAGERGGEPGESRLRKATGWVMVRCCPSGSSSVIFGPAASVSLGDLLKMQVLGPTPFYLRRKLWGWAIHLKRPAVDCHATWILGSAVLQKGQVRCGPEIPTGLPAWAVLCFPRCPLSPVRSCSCPQQFTESAGSGQALPPHSLCCRGLWCLGKAPDLARCWLLF